MVKMMNDSRWYTVLDDRELEYEKQFTNEEGEEELSMEDMGLPIPKPSCTRKHVTKMGTCDDIDDENRVLAIASKMGGKNYCENKSLEKKMETPTLYSTASYDEAFQEYLELMEERQHRFELVLDEIEDACNYVDSTINDAEVAQAVDETRTATQNLRRDLKKLKGA